MRTVIPMTSTEQLHLAAALDIAGNLNGDLNADIRARIFTAADEGTHETWVAARSAIINPATMETLWQAVIRTGSIGASATETPARAEIIGALEQAAVDISMGCLIV